MKKIYLFVFIILSINYFSTAQNRYSSWNIYKYSGPGLKQIGELETKHAKDISESPWSVGCETLDRDYADFSIYKNYVGELGVKHGRLQSGWAKCEKEKGTYNFAWLDDCVNGLAEQSVQPWICLCYGNPIYKSEFRLGAKIFTDDETMNGWLNYVEATVSRYKDVVKEWEIWNEPNLKNGGYEEYGNLLVKTARLIKKIDSDAKIIGFSTAGINLEFTDEVFKILKKNNAIELIDYLCYHPYSENPDNSYPMVEKLQAMAKSYSSKIELFQGENGCPSQLEWTHALAYYPWTEISQAKWFMRRMAGDRVRDIRTSIFTIIDLQYYNMLQSFGLIRSNAQHEIIYKRPSYYGVQHMVSFFDYSVIPTGMLSYSSNANRELTVAGFKKDDTPVALVWYNDRNPGDEMKWDLVSLTIKNTTFKDPIYIEMVSGKVYEIDTEDWELKGNNVVFKNLPVWDSVMMIAERSQVGIK